jgi:hypothetical protein
MICIQHAPIELELECIQPAWTLIRLACIMLEEHAKTTFAHGLGLDAPSMSPTLIPTPIRQIVIAAKVGAVPAGPVERLRRDPAHPNAQSHPELRRRGPEDRAPAEDDWL